MTIFFILFCLLVSSLFAVIVIAERREYLQSLHKSPNNSNHAPLDVTSGYTETDGYIETAGYTETDGYTVTTPDFSRRIIALSDELSNMLIRKNLGKYLMNDCNLIYSEFEHMYLSNYQLRQLLTPIMNDILNRLELPKIVTLHIERKPDNSQEAGYYRTATAYSKEITLYIDVNQSADSVIATLCHECTHYFMEYHNLKIDNEKENEIRTDVYANLIGFNTIMRRGYEPHSHREYANHEEYNHSVKIGYISSDDCSDIYNYLMYKRKMLNVTNKIKKNIPVAELLYEQVTFLYDEATYSEQTKETIKLLKSFRKFASNDIPTIINKCKTIHTNSKDIDTMISTNNTLYKLCADMSQYIHKFQNANNVSPQVTR